MRRQRFWCYWMVFFSLAVARSNAEEIEPWHVREDFDKTGKPLVVVTEDAIHKQRPKKGEGVSSRSVYDYVLRESQHRRQPHHLFQHLPSLTTSYTKRPPSNYKPNTASDPKNFTVAVYYYPWYHTDFHGRGYIRGELVPPQLPVLGEYNDRDPKVIRQHLKWSRQANINLWVASWWGPDSGTDTTIKTVILKELDNVNICFFYETMGRIDVETLDTSKVYIDIAYAAKTYFSHPKYHRIDGRPVLFVYLTRALERLEILDWVLAVMRKAAYESGGHLLYIVGDHTHGDPPKSTISALDSLDAITNYDIFGGMGRPNGHAQQERVQEYFQAQSTWKLAANSQKCAYIPSATPGYNDKAVRPSDYSAMSRKLDKNLPYGSLFRALLEDAKKLVDRSTGNLLVVNSFNEWHEDTQIEPVITVGRSVRPWNLTRGYVYEGYGERYLEILREMTTIDK